MRRFGKRSIFRKMFINVCWLQFCRHDPNGIQNPNDSLYRRGGGMVTVFPWIKETVNALRAVALARNSRRWWGYKIVSRSQRLAEIMPGNGERD